MVRLAKVSRIARPHARDLEDYAYLYRLNIGIYFFALLSAVILFGTAIFALEAANPNFKNIPLGMLWAAKPLLGGIAQEMPLTAAGELVAIFARFTGLVLFGLLIAIVGNSVRTLLFGSSNLIKGKALPLGQRRNRTR